ncbi:DDRGK domain-containing protein 1-like [Artemia franciscana]|uniref:DDRGK domain-containing protein 1 n=1 Tax=Artemia franciscana TaxID=6661 RepID=A0AA88HSA1_ARTSF|nr:hypothetical protein QYM36_011650 [Artemia franciscana]
MDDTVFLVSAALILVVTLFVLKWFSGKTEEKPNEEAAIPEPAVNRPAQVRAVGGRHNQARMRVSAARRRELEGSDEELSESEEEGPKVEIPEGVKVGKKKLAKLEAKAEKRKMREAMDREIEEKKEREARLEEERKKQEELEKNLEAEREEAERKEREERERRENEEYLKLKESFAVEDEGFEGREEDNDRNLLQDFVNYIKSVKVVPLDDLAGHFKLKTTDAISRVEALVEEGSLTGVMDDRGKFIYIAQEELEAVAKFIRQRGRVSISELVQESNKLINLEPDVKALEAIASQ